MPATLWLAAACSLVVPCVPAPAPATPLDDAGYLRVADRLVARLPWDAQRHRYAAGSGTTTEVNADLLAVHAEAALRGHRGAARNDARARAIARLLTGPRIWRGNGWKAGPANANMHVVFQAEAAEGLAAAYAARRALGLDAATVERMRTEIALVARSDRWRWPALELNQLNWYATMFAADATVNGRGA